MKIFCLILMMGFAPLQQAAEFLLIYGDVGERGGIPSGGAPFHQMRLDDTGRRGLSEFQKIVESRGHRITERLDRDTELTPALLGEVDVILFGLHQKIWSEAEKEALHAWLLAGGSMILYSDSAAGGHWRHVGGQNPVGQRAVNNLISRYGVEVTVDQADGVRAVRARPDAEHPLVNGRPVLEGEGVSPFAVAPDSVAEILIPYENDPEVAVAGAPAVRHRQNIRVETPRWAALVRIPVGRGQIFGVFDRQPFWNAGEGSDITKRDNRLIVTRLVDAAAGK